MKTAAFLLLVLPLLSAVSAKGVSLRTSRTKGETKERGLQFLGSPGPASSKGSSSKGGGTSPGGATGPTLGPCPPRVGSGDGGTGKGKGGKGGGGGSDDPCDICYNGKPDTLTLRYELPSANSLYQPESKATCREERSPDYPSPTTISVAGGAAFNATNGTMITLGGSFGANTLFTIDGWGSCTIHTSCSVPLIPGDKIGPFVVVGDEDCTVPPEEEECCIICDSDNKNKPPSLILQYKSDGKNSLYQSESKASCRKDTYPETTTITVTTKTGGEHVFPGVQDGDEIEVFGEFDAHTKFTISDWSGGSCTVHTSCSAPLVQFDQIGPFVVLNPCTDERCISVTKAVYECDEDITVSFDYDFAEPPAAAELTDWIGIYPCGNVEYKHAESWLWACPVFGDVPSTCAGPAISNTLTFQNPMPGYNAGGPHKFPIAPFLTDGPGSEIENCFQALILRLEGPSTPPYIVTCFSEPFTIRANSSPGCQVRDSSSAYSPGPP
mmetsp:Transcript_22567/g.37332  ORF Transcript_22567/g.37332 Transcript_22567/m.37332 type:complete len:496 (+) Transcript_22567:31-1518(+)|eukprot:CAMPEP_0119013734 /NCGR_PEP_ID=MMETSP1176-20130426/8843_1 /TAXON_ID=265551 /ORGANISM="Synedropsis recta cf, Strain CCMP1620" /LENGTH=495 /DNA_ID=CAMNT_0006966847 /DNA_START=31 /DNA_END=1518 /DNA_ORIENTATION=-